MVDALHEVHRVLRPGGVLVDARPDSRVLARVDVAGRTVGTLATQPATVGDDRMSDRAIGRVKRERLFRSTRRGRFWHPMRFVDGHALRAYLDESLRLARRVRWRIPAEERRRIVNEPVAVLRAVRYEVLRRDLD